MSSNYSPHSEGSDPNPLPTPMDGGGFRYDGSGFPSTNSYLVDLPSYDPLHPDKRIADNVVFKEDFDYEGRTRIEKTKDKLLVDYNTYLDAHPEITPMLHDIVLNLLIHQPERPLKDIRSYVRSRKGL